MPDESLTSATPIKGIAEDAKEKSPQVIIATAIALLSDFITSGDKAKELKIAAPVMALIIVVSLTKLTDLSIFLFKLLIDKKPDSEIPLDIRLRKYIRIAKRERFWMSKNSSEYAEQTVHIRGLRKRLRQYQLGKLDVTVTSNRQATPMANPTNEGESV